jgi:hypothetical protein
MYARYEILQVVEGHLFDEDCYERTGALEWTLDARPGFYAVLWPAKDAASRSRSPMRLLGPFPDARVAGAQAQEFFLDLAASEPIVQSRRELRAHARVANRRVL